jgi:hypothetical protein
MSQISNISETVLSKREHECVSRINSSKKSSYVGDSYIVLYNRLNTFIIWLEDNGHYHQAQILKNTGTSINLRRWEKFEKGYSFPSLQKDLSKFLRK